MLYSIAVFLTALFRYMRNLTYEAIYYRSYDEYKNEKEIKNNS